jgi:hypothetical protein
MITASCGNIELLKLPKTAFLCSRNIPASAVLKCYDWPSNNGTKETVSSAVFTPRSKKMFFITCLQERS